MDKSRSHPETLREVQPFTFSQSSLQDFSDCPRRFQLRYLFQLSWPAPIAEPIQENERLTRAGERFHNLARQALLGVSLDALHESVLASGESNLPLWWQHFLQLLPLLQVGECRPEYSVSVPMGEHRLLAKFDLVQYFATEQRAVIWDWKTSLHRPPRARLEKRWQTHLYPYLLARTGLPRLGNASLTPSGIEMVYWFPHTPDQPERFLYSEEQFQRDEESLQAILAEINRRQPSQFEQTADERHCHFCVYRSLCERGIQAGSLEEMEGDIDAPGESSLDLNFDQIGEIAF